MANCNTRKEQVYEYGLSTSTVEQRQGNPTVLSANWSGCVFRNNCHFQPIKEPSNAKHDTD